MAGTRSSARQAEKNGSSPTSTEKKSGIKRKADNDASPESTKSKVQRATKEQKTLEESMPPAEDKEELKDEGFDEEIVEDRVNTDKNGSADAKDNGNAAHMNAFDQVKADEGEHGKTSKPDDIEETTNGTTIQGTAVEEDKQREKAQPSNILEKGIIYFFTRGRVGIDDPGSVTDLQRSFFIMRPLPDGAKLTDGAIQDVGNNRLLALPKKVWPKSGKDRFMVFVEKGKTTMEDLKETFFEGSEYSTKTVGTRHTPEVSMIGEGVYAITSTGSGRTTTHLAYMLTIPREIGEVQKDVGLANKGSFILSVKNPKASGPAYAQLPATPEYPQEILDEFGGLGWLPAAPKHIDYPNASMLLIGESLESGGALEPAPDDEKKDEKEVPKEELEKLEAEDEQRIENLRGDDTIFADLGVSSKEYGLKSTW